MISSCGDFVAYWGSFASLVGLPLALITILLAKSISERIQDERFSKRVTALTAKLRKSQMTGNVKHVQTDLVVFKHALEVHFTWPKILLSKRVRKLYFAVRGQCKSDNPDIQLVEGLLLNFKVIHSETKQ